MTDQMSAEERGDRIRKVVESDLRKTNGDLDVCLRWLGTIVAVQEIRQAEAAARRKALEEAAAVVEAHITLADMSGLDTHEPENARLVLTGMVVSIRALAESTEPQQAPGRD